MIDQQNLFDNLTKAALAEMPGVALEEIENISFCVTMVATRADGSALGGSFIVDPEIPRDMNSEQLVETGSLPSLTSYILLRQAGPFVNRCLQAAASMQTSKLEGVPTPPSEETH